MRGTRPRHWLLAVLVFVFAAACFVERLGSPTALNVTSTEDDVTVYELTEDGEEEFLATIAFGRSVELSIPGDCSISTLVARLPDGTEVERRPPGFCNGDVWRINGDEAD